MHGPNRQIAYVGDGELELKHTDRPDPGPNEAVVRIAFTGICGTDLHILHGAMDSRVSMPAVIGHETSGTVVAIGNEVETAAVGDRVTVLPVVPCDGCRTCEKGNSHVCPNLDFLGIDGPGAMQDFWSVPARLLFPLPEDLALDHAALVEPLAVACHSVRRSGLQPGDRALVAGAGPIGVLIALVARARGGDVVLSEVSEMRRNGASALGIETVDPTLQDLSVLVDEWTRGNGADIGFEAAASAAATMSLIANLGPRGRLVPVGIHIAPVPVALFDVFWRELEIVGSRLYGAEDYEAGIELAASGTLPLAELITRVVPAEDAREAFTDLEAGRAMKVLVEFGGLE